MLEAKTLIRVKRARFVARAKKKGKKKKKEVNRNCLNLINRINDFIKQNNFSNFYYSRKIDFETNNII